MKIFFLSCRLRRMILSSSDSASEARTARYEHMTWTTFGGVTAGIALMYATGLLVAA